jgi:hypothetical protein
MNDYTNSFQLLPAMKPELEARIQQWLGDAPIEGTTHYMFKGRDNLVTLGIGMMIDPIEKYPQYLNPAKWERVRGTGGGPITEVDIKKEFQFVKNCPAAWTEDNYRKATKLRFKKKALGSAFLTTLHEKESGLRKYFSSFDDWPADAKMALIGLAWALGAGGVAQKELLLKACLTWDFATASHHVHYVVRNRETGEVMPDSHSQKKREAQHKIMFNNAAYALYQHIEKGIPLDGDKPFYPDVKLAPANWKPPAGWPPPPQKRGCTLTDFR